MATVADAKPPPGAASDQAVEAPMQVEGTEDPTKESLTPSAFRNTEPLREDQVENAVKFLSHPKVKGSPVIYRRSFLERKGLTREEIDEAFRRVPDPTPSAQAPIASAGVPIISTSTALSVPSSQALLPASAGALSPVATISRPRFRWTHAVFAIGFLAVSGAGTAILIKNAVIPRLKSWIRKIISEEENAEQNSSRPNYSEEAAAAAKAAAAAAAEVSRASQEMLTFKVEEKKYFGNLVNLLEVQLREIKSMNNAIQKLEENANTSSAISAFHQEDSRGWITSTRPTHPNGKADYNSRPVRPTSPPMSRQPSGVPHSESYAEIMAMVQRGERPPNIRDINDSLPDPNRPISNSRVTPRAKTQNNTGFAYQPLSNGGGFNYYGAENGDGSRTNDGGPGPWWQKKNVRITELYQDNELKTGSYSSQFSEQPVRSKWVPPQPPPIAMPEAAEAIRRPKPTTQKELTDDQLMADSSDPSEELQKATKFSEVGGAVDTNSLEMPMNSSNKIQEE